jgi:hypothetical protein
MAAISTGRPHPSPTGIGKLSSPSTHTPARKGHVTIVAKSPSFFKVEDAGGNAAAAPCTVPSS